MKDNIFKYIKNNTIPVKLFFKKFDSVQYQLGFTIFNMQLSIKDMICIQSQQFKKLVIKNTLDHFYPLVIFSFIDFNGIYTNKMRTNGLYLRVVVIPPESSKTLNLKNKIIDMIFSIENHIIVSQLNKEIHYKLECKFWTARNFAMHIPFSTYINPSESNKFTPYLIIKKLMKKINYPIDEIPTSTTKMYYITDQNNTMLDNIKYCLSHACINGEIPSYICHNILLNKPIFVNRDMPKKQENYSINYDLQMVTASGTDNLDKLLVVQDIQVFSSNRTLYHYQQKALDIRWEYDQLNRKWFQRILTPDKIDLDLTCTTLKVNIIKTAFYPETYNESNIRHYSCNWLTHVYLKLKDLLLGTNNVQFKVIGNILRDVGQFVNINCKLINFKNTYSGVWKIYSILHIFENLNYINDIIGYRTFLLNYKEDEEKRG